MVARFDGGRLSSEGGLLAQREIERRLGLPKAALPNCTTRPAQLMTLTRIVARTVLFEARRG